MAEMQMTPGEIRRDYEGAKKKREQLQILADLNCCTVEKIREILIAEGVDKRSLVWTYRQPKGKAAAKTEAKKEPVLKPVQHDYKAALTAVRMHIEGLRAEQEALRARITEINAEVGEIQVACQELADLLD